MNASEYDMTCTISNMPYIVSVVRNFVAGSKVLYV